MSADDDPSGLAVAEQAYRLRAVAAPTPILPAVDVTVSFRYRGSPDKGNRLAQRVALELLAVAGVHDVETTVHE